MKKKILVLAVTIAIIGIITACSSNTTINITPNKDSSSTNDSANDNSSNSGSNSTVNNNSSSTEDNQNEQLLSSIKAATEEGKVINCDFKVDKNVIEDVTAVWGKEDKNEYIEDAKGTYYTFSNKNIVFGCNKGSQIFEIRTFDNSIKSLSLNDVTKYFGNPDYDIVSKLNERIIGYVINDNIKILFVFPNANNSNLKLDHYSVLYPKDTVNMMADDPGREW